MTARLSAMSGVSGELVAVAAEELHQLGMDEQFFPSRLPFLQDVDGGQFLEVVGGRLALGDVLFDQIGNAAVGLLENDIDQFAAVNFGLPFPDVAGRVFRQAADGADFGGGPSRCFFDGLQHEEYPGFPGAVPCNVQQEPVVVGLVGDDMAAQVKDGEAEQVLLDQVEDVDDAPGAAVAVAERVDGLELVMGNGHAYERVDVVLVVQKIFPVGEQFAQPGFAFRRRVDGFAGTVVGQPGAGRAPDVHIDTLGRTANLDCRSRTERALGEGAKASVERGTVAQGFLGGRIGLAVSVGKLEKFVRAGDDVFDFRAVPGFKQGNGVDEHILIGNQLGCLLEFGQRRTGGNAAFEYGSGFDLLSWGKVWQRVVRAFRVPVWRFHGVKIVFWRQVRRICRCRRQVNKTCRIFS